MFGSDWSKVDIRTVSFLEPQYPSFVEEMWMGKDRVAEVGTFREGGPFPVGHVYERGGLLLRVVGLSVSPPDRVYVMQEGWKARVWQRLYRFLSLWQNLERRLLWTFAVWGLVEHELCTIPTWSGFCLFRWLGLGRGGNGKGGGNGR